jgi:hypothetical protein
MPRCGYHWTAKLASSYESWDPIVTLTLRGNTTIPGSGQYSCMTLRIQAMLSVGCTVSFSNAVMRDDPVLVPMALLFMRWRPNASNTRALDWNS